jgi:hypothetical protein
MQCEHLQEYTIKRGDKLLVQLAKMMMMSMDPTSGSSYLISQKGVGTNIHGTTCERLQTQFSHAVS